MSISLPQQIHGLQSETDVAFDFGRLKSLARAIDEKLVAAGVHAGACIALKERKHAVVEGLPNCQFVLTAQNVLLGEFRTLTEVYVLVAERAEHPVKESLRS